MNCPACGSEGVSEIHRPDGRIKINFSCGAWGWEALLTEHGEEALIDYGSACDIIRERDTLAELLRETLDEYLDIEWRTTDLTEHMLTQSTCLLAGAIVLRKLGLEGAAR